jgi:hypothetical protein
MENYKLEKTRPANTDLESIISSLQYQKEFENIKFEYSVKPYRDGEYEVTMGIKDHIGVINPNKWVFKEVSVLEGRQIEYGLLFMEMRLLKNIVAYGIHSAKTEIKERDNGK